MAFLTSWAITVEGMDDKFTVHHQGDKITFSKGIDDDIDFLVPLKNRIFST